MMDMNITMLRDTLKCPQYGYNLHILRRAPERVPVSLEEGQLFHEGMELRLNHPDQTLTPSDLPSWAFVGQEARDSFTKHKLWIPINAFEVPEEWSIIGVETVVSMMINMGLRLKGILDGYIIWNGKLWDVQWKTFSDDEGELIESVRLSWHEVGYQMMSEVGRGIPWGGTILGACQKLPSYRMVEGEDGKKRRQEVTDEMRAAAFKLWYIVRSAEEQRALAENLKRAAMRAETELSWHRPMRNLDACWKPYRKGRCPFFDVCHGGESIHSSKFRNLEDRYAKREVAE